MNHDTVCRHVRYQAQILYPWNNMETLRSDTVCTYEIHRTNSNHMTLYIVILSEPGNEIKYWFFVVWDNKLCK